VQVRVFLAEDDNALRSVLTRGLRVAGYVVDAVADGTEAVEYLRSYEYEVAVLDWNLPGTSGLELVQALRRRGQSLPVLMLTARDAMADRVRGLDEGADDYLTKPFDFDELLARIRALQRRPASAQAPQLSVGDIVFDPSTREIRVAGRSPALTATELAILEVLLRRTPAVVERRTIALHAWGTEADALGSNTIDVHLARLRAKLAGGRAHIETVRGIGYRILPG
jgi:DNA-binding response OmpR family regulator